MCPLLVEENRNWKKGEKMSRISFLLILLLMMTAATLFRVNLKAQWNDAVNEMYMMNSALVSVDIPASELTKTLVEYRLEAMYEDRW